MSWMKLVLAVLLFSSFGFAWFNTNFTTYQETNITLTNGTSAYYFNVTTPLDVNGSVIWTTNGSGSEALCGGWWKVKNESANRWILNCSVRTGTTSIRLYYNNSTGVSDYRNATKACYVGDEFEGQYQAGTWTEMETAGTQSYIFSGGTMNLWTTVGANSLLKSNRMAPNLSVMETYWNNNTQLAGGYGSFIGIGQGLNNVPVGTGVCSAFDYASEYLVTSDGAGRDLSALLAPSTPTTYRLATIYAKSPTDCAIYDGTNRFSGNNCPKGNDTYNLGTITGLGGTEWANMTIEWTCAYQMTNATGWNFVYTAWSGEVYYTGSGGTNTTLAANATINILPAPIQYHNTSQCNISYNTTKNTTIYWGIYRNLYLYSSGSTQVAASGTTTLASIVGNTTGDVWTCMARFCDATSCTGYYTDRETVMEMDTGITIYPLTTSFVLFWEAWGALLAGTFAVGMSWAIQKTISGTCFAASLLNIGIYLLSTTMLGTGSYINIIFAIVLLLVGAIVRYTNN